MKKVVSPRCVCKFDSHGGVGIDEKKKILIPNSNVRVILALQKDEIKQNTTSNIDLHM